MAESADIRTRLEQVERKIDSTADKIDRLAEDVAAIRELVTGNGDPSKGMVVRQDRMEQTVARWTKLITVALGTAIAALVSTVVRLVTKP
jgi:hypothetical protein